MKNRYANLERILSLDPERDYLAIYQMMVRFEFPWDMKLALNLAFNRSFATPTIAAVLADTGELLDRTQKRLDDTGIIMYELMLEGFDSPRGREVIRRINEIHRPFRHIANDEYLYVLACCVVIPLRWLDRYGWRPPSQQERQATFRFYSELGRRMRVQAIPGSLTEFESWFDRYDEDHLLPNDNAAAIERATRMLLRTRIPRVLAPFSESLIAALYDDRLRAAMKVPRPAWLARTTLRLSLLTRARIVRHFMRSRAVGIFEAGIVTRTYPDGYSIDALGPAKRQ